MSKFSMLAGAALAAILITGCATANDRPGQTSTYDKTQSQGGEFNENELVIAFSEHLGVTSESAASVVERIFREQGRPNAYITGEEGGGAVAAGLFYGKGTLWMKDGRSIPVYWQGPTIGLDTGIDASKVFTLVYNLDDPQTIYQRFPKAEGSAYLVGGMAINYQQSGDVIIAPVRTGVGVRLGANIGYVKYSNERRWWPF